MYAKYRLFLITARASYFMAASNTVNDLVRLVKQWLETTAEGRSVYDDQAQAVDLYELDPKRGDYVRSARLPVTSREDIITKVRELGGR